MTEGEAKLVRMALEIQQFFRHRGDAADGLAADHIKQFWAPSMRKAFQAVLAREGGSLAPEARAIGALLPK
jgi:hypothetical protein